MEIRSSYLHNNFGQVFLQTILAFPPYSIVEVGVLDGYSLLHMAIAIEKLGSNVVIDAYDLWEDYEYNHGNMDDVKKLLSLRNVSHLVNLHKENAYKVHKKYENNMVDFLHFDISNDGDVFDFVMEKWTPKMRHCGLIFFEGGSEERDNVDWMVKYNKKPIRPAINSNKIANENYIYGTFSKFPSLTVMKKVTR